MVTCRAGVWADTGGGTWWTASCLLVSSLFVQSTSCWKFHPQEAALLIRLRQMTLNYSSYFWINGCRSDSVLRVLHLILRITMMGDTFSSFCSWAREVINLQSFQSCGAARIWSLHSYLLCCSLSRSDKRKKMGKNTFSCLTSRLSRITSSEIWGKSVQVHLKEFTSY